MAEEQKDIPLGERTIHVNSVPVIIYRTADGQDWTTTRQAHWYLQTTPYMAGKKIREWETQKRIKRERIKGNSWYILLSDLDRIKEEIHSTKNSTEE